MCTFALKPMAGHRNQRGVTVNKVQKRIEQAVAVWFMLCVGAAVLLVLYLVAFEPIIEAGGVATIGMPGLIVLIAYALVMAGIGLKLHRKIRGQ